jgi:hypothetical protein
LTLDLLTSPLLGRAGFKHEIIDKAPLTINDDVVGELYYPDCPAETDKQQDLLQYAGQLAVGQPPTLAYQKEKKFYNWCV